MKIESIEFYLSNSNADKIIYDIKTDTFTYIGNYPNTILNYFIGRNITNTIDRMKFIKGLKSLKNTLINESSEEIESKYEEHLIDNCSWCKGMKYLQDYENLFRCGHCDFEQFIFDLFPINPYASNPKTKN